MLRRAIKKKLKAAGLDLSATQALTALKSVRVVEIALGNGTAKRSVTRATSVLRAVCGERFAYLLLRDKALTEALAAA